MSGLAHRDVSAREEPRGEECGSPRGHHVALRCDRVVNTAEAVAVVAPLRGHRRGLRRLLHVPREQLRVQSLPRPPRRAWRSSRRCVTREQLRVQSLRDRLRERLGRRVRVNVRSACSFLPSILPGADVYTSARSACSRCSLTPETATCQASSTATSPLAMRIPERVRRPEGSITWRCAVIAS